LKLRALIDPDLFHRTRRASSAEIFH